MHARASYSTRSPMPTQPTSTAPSHAVVVRCDTLQPPTNATALPCAVAVSSQPCRVSKAPQQCQNITSAIAPPKAALFPSVVDASTPPHTSQSTKNEQTLSKLVHREHPLLRRKRQVLIWRARRIVVQPLNLSVVASQRNVIEARDRKAGSVIRRRDEAFL